MIERGPSAGLDPFFFRNRMSALLDGELEPIERQQMEAAIAENPELAASWAHFRDGVLALRREGPVRAPDELAAAVVVSPPSRTSRLPRVLLGLILIGAVPLLLLTWGDPVERGEAPPAGEIPAPERLDVGAALGAGGGGAGEPELVREYVGDPMGSSTTPLLDEVQAVQAASGLTGRDALRADDPSRDRPPAEAVAEGVGRDLPGGLTPEGAAAMARRGESSGGNVPTIRVRGRTVTVERAPYYAPWEQPDEPTPAPSAAPGDYRLRLLANRDTVLQELAVLVRAVGGDLYTPGGAPLAPYPMDPGDARLVHARVPASALGALVQNLPALGTVEALATPPAEGTTATVRIEVQQP